ncbi:hypothetical protein BKD30_05060 [Tersicoccus phoenicis]|uniref:Uncharacterized protein n=1 Tax=Tersicoccus phoenicis TaxID=554083 RepID=A0A1R1LFN4_9MICC|nr:hypothetical protein [Tersicoccus phoenicis]OMH26333.1 hypothetical protein BKD30_05060 [Tersicoccus phoenicis]
MSAMLLESVDPATPVDDAVADDACLRCDGDITGGRGFAGLCPGCLTDSCADCLAALHGDEGADDGRCHACG